MFPDVLQVFSRTHAQQDCFVNPEREFVTIRRLLVPVGSYKTYIINSSMYVLEYGPCGATQAGCKLAATDESW